MNRQGVACLRFVQLATLSAAVALAGCVHYQPQPISASHVATDWEGRSLADDGLRAFVATNAPELAKAWPPPTWDLRLLTLAAFYYHPDLDVARARWGVARAGIVTASGRPNPSVGVGTSFIPPGGADAWILQPSLDIPIETFGKRGYRIQQAKHLSEAGRLELAATAWTVRSRLRSALAAFLRAQSEAELLTAEEHIRSELVSILEARVALGDLPRQLATDARIDLNRIRQQRLESEGRLEQSQVALAESIGVPAAALGEGMRFDFPQTESLPAESSVANRVQRDALLNRLDIRRGLVEYAASESALRLEIAKQYPDVQITPGYRWRETEQRWQLGLSVMLPLLNQNQGPIAEALAKRELAAAQFQSIQAVALSELDRTLSGYRSAQRSLTVAEETVKAAEVREKEIQEAFAVGDVDAGAVAEARLITAVAKRDRLAALRNAQAALGALEDAVQKPLDDASPIPTVPETQQRTAQSGSK